MTLEELESIEDPEDGWVEWPSFPENENKFDWSLSYEDLDKLYNPAFKSKVRRFDYKRSTSFPPPVEKKIKDDHLSNVQYLNYEGKECPCVGFIDRAYSLTGVAGVRQYQIAYYHSGIQRYLFMVQGGILAYEKEKVEKFIKPFLDKEKTKPLASDAVVKKQIQESPTIVAEKKKSEEESIERTLFISRMTPDQFHLMKKHGWKIAKLLTDPQENFHYE